VVFLFGVGAATAQKPCGTSEISETASIGANEVVTFSKVRKLRQIAGRVVNPGGGSIPTAIVDVFPFKKVGNGGVPMGSESQRIRSYRVDKEGFFCLADLPEGKFTLRFGTNVFAFKHMIIVVRKVKEGSAKPMEVRLDVGT
jgi:hypothetical protein